MPRLALRETRHERNNGRGPLSIDSMVLATVVPLLLPSSTDFEKNKLRKRTRSLAHFCFPLYLAFTAQNAIPLPSSLFIVLPSLSLSLSVRRGIVAVKRRNNDKSVSAGEEKEFLVVVVEPPPFEARIIVSLPFVLVDFAFNRKWLSDAFYRR